ncbi:putative HAT dimerization domain, ribonuclease H-like domain-containing protein [Rosa chinensis]|uniref:Putative HAT dimerization domain, ribonuclease H-like domain-containing protein n=1 Tax=Rosa chinensis TaxID=74649 RepID=A0A2P6SGA5_ROSCH|nr:putative HAT dimerization domain, ribonuclease H-like domain-containing protein [Rosa chinensis]
MNQLLLVALVLDPRFKLKNISHICLTHLQFDATEANAKANEVKELLVCLTDLYRSSTNASSKSKSSRSSTGTSCVVSSSTKAIATSSKSKEKSKKMSGKMAEMLEGWQRALTESDEVVVESEVDRYLLDPMENPKDEDWQLLEWWKINGCKYPNLALVTRDVLAIQVSTVASESSFRTGGRVIDPFRSSLTPKSVEALICLQNWIKKRNQSDIEYYPSLEKLEFYEKMEIDVAKGK